MKDKNRIKRFNQEVSNLKRSEQLKINKTCFMCSKEKPNDGHTCCEDCGGVSF